MNVLRIILISALVSCGSGSNVTTNASASDKNVSKFEESKFGSSSFN